MSSTTRGKFGKIVESLRKERIFYDDNGNPKGWTRKQLVKQMGDVFTEYQVQQIENGDKVTPQEDILNALANAFNLTTSERSEFFLLTINVAREKIPRPESSADEALKKTLGYLSGIRLPFFISDGFCDVIRINKILEKLLSLEEFVKRAPNRPEGYNTAFFTFNNDEQYKNLMGDRWEKHAIYNMRYFRERTLTSRHHPYFSKIRSELLQQKEFKDYWQKSQEHEDDDYFSGHIGYDYCHPNYGQLKYVACETITVTTEGNLSVITYAPTDSDTANIFEKLAREVGTYVIEGAPWPKPWPKE